MKHLPLDTRSIPAKISEIKDEMGFSPNEATIIGCFNGYRTFAEISGSHGLKSSDLAALFTRAKDSGVATTVYEWGNLFYNNIEDFYFVGNDGFQGDGSIKVEASFPYDPKIVRGKQLEFLSLFLSGHYPEIPISLFLARKALLVNSLFVGYYIWEIILKENSLVAFTLRRWTENSGSMKYYKVTQIISGTDHIF